MALDLLRTRGTPLSKQKFTWKELVQPPLSKLDSDAFTRVRVILMNGIEMEAIGFSHAFARKRGEFRLPLAQIRRIEKHQQALINWLISADHSPLETTIAYEQVAIEVTAALAQQEPDKYLAQAYRFGLLEDFDHMYRFSALLDRLEGKDANNILQSYTDILPGRPTPVEHRAPQDDLRTPYNAAHADPITKLNALTLVAAEQQTQNYYMNIGPLFADPLARLLYAEISAIEEQHVTHYESLIDPSETWLEKWVMHEALEVYNYYSCVEQETDPRIQEIWDRCLNYELGHLEVAKKIFEDVERRDVAEILPARLPDPIPFESQRDFVRDCLMREVDLRTLGASFVPAHQESSASREYRNHMNSEGSPSKIVADGYMWYPGGEFARVKPTSTEVRSTQKNTKKKRSASV